LSRVLDSDEKLMSLAAQIRAAELGISKIIVCPYCQTRLDFSPNPQDIAPSWCCQKIALAASAIIQRQAQNEVIDMANRALDKSKGIAVFN
jgi:hypothetical protein